MRNRSIARRTFLRHSAAGVALGTAGKTVLAGGPTANSLQRQGQPFALSITRADVLVVGGGTAGCIAAIQAGRAGASTVLLEQGSQLGGMLTTGGVAFPGLFHAWGRQIIAGIGWELVSECVALDGARLPDFSQPPSRHWHHQIMVNPFLYALLAEEKCVQAGVTVLYYEFPWSIAETAEGWCVESVGMGTQRRILCKQVIDCTGGAEVIGLVPLPRLREDERQPGSMLFKCDEVYQPGREQLQAVYVPGADSSTSITRTAANLAGRRAILEKIRGRRLTHLQPEAAVRESCRILGHVVISHADYCSGRLFDDAVCFAFYPVDLHTREGVTPRPLAQGVVPSVPLRALIPKNSRNILAAGRSVSSDRLADSGLRVQACCMAMGQAAGAAAALAAHRDTTPLKLPVQEIRALLKKHGAIVPGDQGNRGRKSIDGGHGISN